ncbi:MAG: hypothetical protein HY515_00500 [Candidatus Aenigmarchaeota archaeon]|nr:hypothetical protein [Candidatus Aenigmarchaeota archaeon]
MASDSLIVKSWAGVVAFVVLLLFYLVSGPTGILNAFSTLSIASGLLIVILLFFRLEGNANVGVGLALSSILIVGGFLVASTTGFTSIATFITVFGAVLVFVYGMTEKNKHENNILLLTISAAIIIFFGGGALPADMSVTATGLMFLITAFGVITFIFSKFSDEESGLKWALFIATIALVGGLLFVFLGFLPTFVFGILVLFAFAAAKTFPGSTSGSGVISFIGTTSAILVVFFLASVQGLFPGMLRAFSLLILAAGLVTIAFFLRIGEREIPGVAKSGFLLGTILTLVGLYLLLF